MNVICNIGVMLALVLMLVVDPAMAEPTNQHIAWQSERTAWFSGRTGQIAVELLDRPANAAEVVWSVKLADRVVARHREPIAADEDLLTWTVEFAALKPGVTMSGEVSAELVDSEGKTLGEPLTRSITLFSPEVFAGKKQWLKSLEIALFDPSRATLDVLEPSDVPLTFIRSTAALAGIESGVIIIGEGTSWKTQPTLPTRMLELAASGRTVLCMAPLEGRLPLPEPAGEAGPTRLTWRDGGFVSELDKRLNTQTWPADATAFASRLRLAWDDGPVATVDAAGDIGWPWLEIEYSNGGRLIITGARITGAWEQTPAARYILLKLLERADPARRDP